MHFDQAACAARQIAGDADKDKLGHKSVLSKIKLHDAQMEEERPVWGLMKAAESTDYWNFVDDNDKTVESTKNGQNLGWLYDGRIEVNRIKPAMTQFIAALYPRRMEAVVERNVLSTGNEQFSAMVLNAMMQQPRARDRIKMVARQSIMFGFPGLKVGFDRGPGNPLDRVWTVAIPAWEMLLDRDARDWSQARYFGHIYYLPKHEVEEEYGLEGLTGTTRDDFLGTRLEDNSKSSRDVERSTHDQGEKDDDYVRVVELCNMVDTWKIGDCEYKGRFEVWVLGQGEKSRCPVYMGPMPLDTVAGRPLPHIMPCILDHAIDFPFRGTSTMKAMMPQQAELNAGRTHLVQLGRRDVRTYMMPEGMFDSKQLQKLRRGIDGQVLTYKDGMAGDGGVSDPERAFVALKHQPVSANNQQSTMLAEQDLMRAIPASPQSLGIVTKATAEEVRTVEAHTESMFGELAEQRDVWLIDWLRLCLRAIVAAMYACEEEEEAEEVVEDAESVEDYGVELEPPEESDVPAEEAEPVKPALQAMTITVMVDKEIVEIAVEDLDSDFDIGLSESGRTPMGDAQRRQDLVSMMEPASMLIKTAAEGRGIDAKAALGEWASRWYDELHMASDWPKSLSLDIILGAAEDRKVKEPPMPQPQPQQGGPPDLMQMPPDQALQILATALEEEHPEAAQIAVEALAGPPEAQPEVVAQLVQYVNGVA